jgi:outer membrane protein assembly factor BamE (lipoprotein component of BamABCDE complex)
MNSRKLPALARGLLWLSIVILIAALAGCQHSGSSTNGNSTTQTGNAVTNEGVLNQNSGTGG